MGKPDTLLCSTDHRSGQGDNNNLTLLSLALFCIHALSGIQLEDNECNIPREVIQSLQYDKLEEPVAMAAHKLHKDKGRDTVKSPEWSESDRLLMFRGKIYIPKDRELRCCIIKEHHDMHITGHTGCFKTLELVSHNYWWPQMSRYIRLYIKTCDLCNQIKLQCCQPSTP
jgi:hypothetical protein